MKFVLLSALILAYPTSVESQSPKQETDSHAVKVRVALALSHQQTGQSVLDDETAKWIATLKPIRGEAKQPAEPQKTKQAAPVTPAPQSQQPAARPQVVEQRYYQPAYPVVPQGYYYPQQVIPQGYYQPQSSILSGANCVSGT